jgi:hypothetical protein
MPLNKRIFVIMGIGSFLISLEVFGFRIFDRETTRITRVLGSSLQFMGNVVLLSASLAKFNGQSSTLQPFHWDWHEWQELSARESLRKTKIDDHDRHAIAAAITAQLRPIASDLEINSENDLAKAVLDTRIKMIDLNHDGTAEIVAQGMVNCSATGNCPFWIFQKKARGWKLLLESEGQTFTIQKTSTNGFRDIVVTMHTSATESGLTDFRFSDGRYYDRGCYDASWEVLEGEKVRELKEPTIVPCVH